MGEGTKPSLSSQSRGLGARLRAAPKTPLSNETPISPEQCRAARAVLNLSQTKLARAAGLGRSTVADYERAARLPSPESLAALRTALESAGKTLIPANGGGSGVRLRE